MGREVRRVPAGWQHPMDEQSGRLQPMFDRPYREAVAEWKEGYAAWERGERDSYCDEASAKLEFWEWSGDPPDRKYYRPDWTDAERTHLQMYETTSEGTPISPVMETPEELARWLADNGASSFGSNTATYEQWLRVCKGGWAPSAIMDSRGFRSGVEALGDKP